MYTGHPAVRSHPALLLVLPHTKRAQKSADHEHAQSPATPKSCQSMLKRGKAQLGQEQTGFSKATSAVWMIKQITGGFSLDTFVESLLRWSHDSEKLAVGRRGICGQRRFSEKEGVHRQMESCRSQRAQSFCLTVSRPRAKMTMLLKMIEKYPLNWVTREGKATTTLFLPAK